MTAPIRMDAVDRSSLPSSQIELPNVCKDRPPTKELVRNWVREDASKMPQVAISVAKIRTALSLNRGTGRTFVSTLRSYKFHRAIYISLPDAVEFIKRFAPTETLLYGLRMELEYDVRRRVRS